MRPLSLRWAAITALRLYSVTAKADVLNLNEVCLSSLAQFLFGHLGVCGAPSDLHVPDGEDYSPWTTKPMCLHEVSPSGSVDDTFCVYTHKTFSEGRGITIITTAAIAKQMAEAPAFTDPDTMKGVNDLVNPPWGPPPYEMRVLPGRGFGMIANRTIFRGERIMQETPSMVYNRNLFSLFSDEDRIPLHWHAVYQLPNHTRDELLALHKHHGGDEVDDIMRTNAFGAYYGDPYILHNNVLPRISRFNHDCRPNSHYYFDSNTMTQYVHAVRDIYPDEEILINYTDSEYSYAERQHAIHLSWGFNCQCSICRQPATHVAASDTRLALIKNLKEELNDWTSITPDRTEMAETLVSLYEQERLHVPIATAYEAAAYAYAIVGNEQRARKYATLSVEAMTIMYGANHPLTQDLSVMMINPREHRTWMYEVPVEGQKEKVNKTEEENKWKFF